MTYLKRPLLTAFLVPVLFLLTCTAAQASGSLSTTTISPSNTIAAGTRITFTVIPTGFTSPTYLLDDNFGGSTLTSGNIDSSGNFSWTPTSNDIGTHSFTITATDGQGAAANTSVTISVTAPIMTLSTPSPSATIAVGGSVTFSANVAGLTNPTFSLSDQFGGTSLTNANINSGGYFTWTPSAQDVGTHSITVTAKDGFGHTLTGLATITVNSAATLSIQSLSPLSGSVTPGQSVSFSVLATGMSNPSFTVTDTFFPNTVTNANINASGVFSWTPSASETGTHNLFVVVTDSGTGRTQSITQTIAVQLPNVTIVGATGSLVAPGTTVGFGVSVNGFTDPTYTVGDTFSGTSILHTNVGTGGYFSWVPTAQDVGNHTITIYVSDAYGHTGNVSQLIVVQSASLSLQSVYPSLSIAVGTPLSFTVQPYNFTSPTYALSDTFAGVTTMSNTNLSTNGNFAWTPTSGDVGAHNVRIAASDAYGHSASTTFTVTVGGVYAPLIANPLATQTSTGTNKHKFTHPISYGQHGSEVRALQQRLMDLGYFNGPVNGNYGPLTRAAVKNFQAKHHLEQIGNVGPGTRAALNAE